MWVVGIIEMDRNEQIEDLIMFLIDEGDGSFSLR